MRRVDWEALAKRLGSLGPSFEEAGSVMALSALEQIVGEDNCRSAVDHCVAFRPGYALARQVLRAIHPATAMARCHEIYAMSSNIDDRRSAIELLTDVADARVLPQVSGYLADPDTQIQCWAAAIVDQLLWSELASADECAVLLQTMAEHPNSDVRERHTFITCYLADRKL